jgi:DNA-binding NtrC family response regulator
VAATNSNLLLMVAQQKFRGDLYHRLAEYVICLPPLRERKQDLVFLVDRFLAQTSKELGKAVRGMSTAAWGLIQAYSWPGNARELRNQLRRAVLLCDDPKGMITPENLGMLTGRTSPSNSFLPAPSVPQGEVKSGRRACPLCDPARLLVQGLDVSLKDLSARVVAQTERAILLQALTLTGGNKAQAARMLHIDYKTIHSKLKSYQISSTPFMKDAYQA